MEKKIGLIADTHFSKTRRLNSKIVEFFSDVSIILHAGDIGERCEFEKLKSIAPVIAVLGNQREDWLGCQLKIAEIFKTDHTTIFLTHGLGNKLTNYFEYFLGKTLQLKSLALSLTIKRLRRQSKSANIVVFGHLHHICIKKIGDQVFINPGAAYNTTKRIGSVAKIIFKENGQYEIQVCYLMP